MQLTLKPAGKGPTSTISELLIDGAHECYVLEDVVREIPGVPVASWKIPHQTAIPAGRYQVIINRSERFSKSASQKAGHPVDVFMPLLLSVPGFDGIRIHWGNKPADTDGCMITGDEPEHRFDDDWISGSKAAYDALMAKLVPAVAAGSVFIEVHRDFSEAA